MFGIQAILFACSSVGVRRHAACKRCDKAESSECVNFCGLSRSKS